jgi:hypothetical protein
MNASTDLTLTMVNDKVWDFANMPAVGRHEHIDTHARKHFETLNA